MSKFKVGDIVCRKSIYSDSIGIVKITEIFEDDTFNGYVIQKIDAWMCSLHSVSPGVGGTGNFTDLYDGMWKLSKAYNSPLYKVMHNDCEVHDE